ncbi:MAG: hypothetical protein MUO64_13100 [Anaerolineales bacterium]|nr:hypothetical protein [Anaerolineales bacterium]
MKRMRFETAAKQIVLSSFFLLLCLYMAVIASAASPVMPNRWEGSTLVYEVGDWRLNIEYLQIGSRSEGQNGVLYKNGKEVKASQKNEIKKTPIGTLKYYGERGLSNRPWDNTGWNFSDTSLIKRSEDVKIK